MKDHHLTKYCSLFYNSDSEYFYYHQSGHTYEKLFYSFIYWFSLTFWSYPPCLSPAALMEDITCSVSVISLAYDVFNSLFPVDIWLKYTDVEGVESRPKTRTHRSVRLKTHCRKKSRATAWRQLNRFADRVFWLSCNCGTGSPSLQRCSEHVSVKKVVCWLGRQ